MGLFTKCLLISFCLVYLFQASDGLQNPAKQYEPSRMVKRYGEENAFPAKEIKDEDSDAIQDWARDRGEPAIAVLVFAILIYLCCLGVNCVCCCCKPKSGPCSPWSTFQNQPMKSVCVLSLFVIFLIILALVAYGFENSSDQDKGLDAIPDQLTAILNVIQEADDAITYLNDALVNLLNAIDAIDPATCEGGNPNEDLLELSNLTEKIKNELTGDEDSSGSNADEATDPLLNELDNFQEQIEENRKTAQDGVDEASDRRKQAMTIMLVFLLLVGLCSITIAGLNAAEKISQKSAGCQCVSSTFIMTITFLTLVLASITYFVVLLGGDFCYDPINNLLTLQENNTNSSEDLNYYLKCVDEPDLESPLQQSIDSLNEDIEALNETVAKLPVSCRLIPPGQGHVPGTTLNDLVSGIQYRATGAGTAYNDTQDVAPLLERNTGLLGCYQFNALVMGFLFDICSTFYDPLAVFWEITFCIGFFFILSELISKCMMSNDHDDDFDSTKSPHVV